MLFLDAQRRKWSRLDQAQASSSSFFLSLPIMSVPYYSSWQMSSHDYHHTNPLPPSVEALYPPHQNYAVAHSDLSYDSSSGPPQPVLHRWTPSPTPSEQKELGKGAIDWDAMINWRFWIRREWLCMCQDSNSNHYCVSLMIVWIQGIMLHWL